MKCKAMLDYSEISKLGLTLPAGIPWISYDWFICSQFLTAFTIALPEQDLLFGHVSQTKMGNMLHNRWRREPKNYDVPFPLLT
jgi:hypothetical protein